MLLFALAGTGCPDANQPDTVAGRFVDAYYIEFDLDRAKTLAHGAALRRIEDEAALVDVARKQTAIQEAKARVYYEAPERRDVADDMVHFRYVLDIRRGGSQIEQPSIVMVARREGRWKVIQFREEGAPPRPGLGVEREGVATSTRTASP